MSFHLNVYSVLQIKLIIGSLVVNICLEVGLNVCLD